MKKLCELSLTDKVYMVNGDFEEKKVLAIEIKPYNRVQITTEDFEFIGDGNEISARCENGYMMFTDKQSAKEQYYSEKLEGIREIIDKIEEITDEFKEEYEILTKRAIVIPSDIMELSKKINEL